jgi:general secretion pathway protein F
MATDWEHDQDRGDPDEAAAGKPVTLDELVALNDEIIALARAGVPLEMGLREFGGDRSSALAALGSRLAGRMSRGVSLGEALRSEGAGLPPTYSAIVEAGLLANRLPEALEAVSEFARRMSELRRRVAAAMAYPLMLLVVAYGLFVLFILPVPVRQFVETFQDFGSQPPAFLEWLEDMADSWASWAWIPPLVLVALLAWWRATAGAASLEFTGISRPLAWIPGVASVGRNFRLANFADLLATLVANGVPLPESVLLAADATGDSSLRAQARAVSDAAREGQSGGVSLGRWGFPPYLLWLVTRQSEQEGLVSGLRAASAMYRARAVQTIDWIRLVFPVLAATVLGGAVTLVYCLTVFIPIAKLINDLS